MFSLLGLEEINIPNSRTDDNNATKGKILYEHVNSRYIYAYGCINHGCLYTHEGMLYNDAVAITAIDTDVIAMGRNVDELDLNDTNIIVTDYTYKPQKQHVTEAETASS